MASWYGYPIFIIGLIIAIVQFAKYKKIYSVLYTSSICLYVFTVGFAIDKFNLGKNLTLGILIFSAVIFIFLGRYLSKIAKGE